MAADLKCLEHPTLKVLWCFVWCICSVPEVRSHKGRTMDFY